MNLVANPFMEQAWQLNPNLQALHPDDDDGMISAKDDAILRAMDVRYKECETTAHIEALAMAHETNEAKTKKQKWKGQERWQGRENEEMRVVNILHPNKFIFRLQRAGIDARKEYSQYARLWLYDNQVLDRVGIGAWVKDEATERVDLKTVSTLQDAGSPEWSVMRFNEWDVPTNEKYRGWRTALLHLIFANVITEEEAHRAFGKPIENEASEFYRQQLQTNRKRRLGLQV